MNIPLLMHAPAMGCYLNAWASRDLLTRPIDRAQHSHCSLVAQLDKCNCSTPGSHIKVRPVYACLAWLAEPSSVSLSPMQLNQNGMEPADFEKWQAKFQRKQKDFAKVSYMIMICMKRQVGGPILSRIAFGAV